MKEFIVGQPRIVCAAMRNEKGDVIIGIRHNDTFMREAKMADGRERWRGAEQGFVDQFGVFLSREAAWIVATEAGQIVRRCGVDEGRLFSENLY